jgi:hypothetical protein
MFKKLRNLFKYIINLVKSGYTGKLQINFHKGDFSKKVKKVLVDEVGDE